MKKQASTLVFSKLLLSIMSKILGQKGQLKHRFFILSYENKADPTPDSAYQEIEFLKSVLQKTTT